MQRQHVLDIEPSFPLPVPIARRARRSRTLALSCPSSFAAAVERLAERRGLTLSGLAQVALQAVGPEEHRQIPDPGDAAPNDRVLTVSVSHDGRRRIVRRRPVLRLRLSPEVQPERVRRALAVLVALADERRWAMVEQTWLEARDTEIEAARARIEALEAAFERVAFRLLPKVRTPQQAAHMLGFAHEFGLDEQTVMARFRELALIFHPDAGLVASPRRMAQLIEARTVLIAHVRS